MRDPLLVPGGEGQAAARPQGGTPHPWQARWASTLLWFANEGQYIFQLEEYHCIRFIKC